MTPAIRPRNVVILLYPRFQSLDVTGPLEVFDGARRLVEARARAAEAPGNTTAPSHATRAERPYDVHLLSPDGAPVASSSGLTITPHGALSDAPGEIDTLLIAGGAGHVQAAAEATLIDWIAAASARARRTASVCTGAFLLARAGLLDGRRVTTHWADAAKLQSEHPRVEVDHEPIFVRDGELWTSAGVTAGMDLALALVEEDIGGEAALLIARHLVLFLRRPGNQSQFSATLGTQSPVREPLREIQRAVLEDVAAAHTVEAMAERAHMSARHFARAFRAETGMTPAHYVERVRLEAARRALEEGSQPIAAVARACGFGTPETMRRAFLRALAVGPAEYRRRFRAGAMTDAA